MESVLTAEQLRFGYKQQPIVDELSIAINKGERVSIIGPNGSGKSTVLRLLTRLLTPEQGTVYLEGQAIADMNTRQVARTMTMLPQTQEHLLDLTVYDLVQKGRHPHLRWFEECRNEHLEIVEWALSMTDMTTFKHRALYTLSGGERQRAWIAMAIAQTPNTLLLDEPTTYLDISHQLEIMELLKQLNEQQGITIVMVLHDLNQAARYSDRIIAMKNGKVVRQGPPAEVYDEAFFQEVFSIQAKIHYDEGTPIFTPFGLVKALQTTP